MELGKNKYHKIQKVMKLDTKQSKNQFENVASSLLTCEKSNGSMHAEMTGWQPLSGRCDGEVSVVDGPIHLLTGTRTTMSPAKSTWTPHVVERQKIKKTTLLLKKRTTLTPKAAASSSLLLSLWRGKTLIKTRLFESYRLFFFWRRGFGVC